MWSISVNGVKVKFAIGNCDVLKSRWGLKYIDEIICNAYICL